MREVRGATPIGTAIPLKYVDKTRLRKTSERPKQRWAKLL
jgi:hypothetical protein